MWNAINLVQDLNSCRRFKDYIVIEYYSEEIM